MFKILLSNFMSSRIEFYDKMKERVGSSKIHLPIPIHEGNKEFSLGALIHWLWSVNLARPHTLLKVSKTGAQYVRYVDRTKNLENWVGPVFDQTFEDNEKRLLEISSEVFEHYVTNSTDNLVKEYAEKFLTITPTEFLVYYEELNPRFLNWLKRINTHSYMH